MVKSSFWLGVRKGILNSWYWIILFVLTIITICYSILRLYNQIYWDGAIGNCLATLLGVVTGIPIALAVERGRVSREKREQDAEDRRNALKVAQLIRDELSRNKERVAMCIKDQTVLLMPPFKTDLWEALSDSGEIAWIRNPTLINKIASAYFYTRTVKAIEAKCYEADRGINVHYDDGTSASQRLLSDARGFDIVLDKQITEAIRAIEEAYGEKSAE